MSAKNGKAKTECKVESIVKTCTRPLMMGFVQVQYNCALQLFLSRILLVLERKRIAIPPIHTYLSATLSVCLSDVFVPLLKPFATCGV